MRVDNAKELGKLRWGKRRIGRREELGSWPDLRSQYESKQRGCAVAEVFAARRQYSTVGRDIKRKAHCYEIDHPVAFRTVQRPEQAR